MSPRAHLIAAVLWLAAWPAWSAVPQRVEMDVVVEARGFRVGEGRDVFEHDGRQYRTRSEARTAGIARALRRVEERRESAGLVTEAGLKPITFTQQRTGKPPRTATFDWGRDKLTLDEGGDVETVALPAFTLDQTSLPYTFLFMDVPRDKRFVVHVTDGRKLQEYELSLVGREQITTPLGTLDTLHFRKVPPPGDPRGFEFWLALEHHRLPVRIRIVEKDGTAFDSTVTRISYPAQ
jgi:hypothetical protein